MCVCVCVCVSLSLSLSPSLFPTFFFVSTGSSSLKKSEKECGSTTNEPKSPRAFPRTTTPNSNNNGSNTTNNVPSPHYDRHPCSGTRGGPGSWAPTGRWDRPPAAPGWPTTYITVRLCTKGIIANSLIIIILLLLLLFSFWGRWEGEQGIRNRESRIRIRIRISVFCLFFFSNSIL